MSVASTRKFTPSLVGRYHEALFYAIAAVVALYPLLHVDIPPLVDYPAHLARLHILSSISADPAIQANYEVDWRLIPNLGIDLIGPPLAALLGPYAAGKLFVALAILTPVAGVAALRKALFGAIGYAPALTFIVAYNMCLMTGFLNFLFTAGLALLAYAGWIASRQRPGFVRATGFAGIAMILYLGHLFAFAAYALLIGLDTLQQIMADPRRNLRTVAMTLVFNGIQFAVPGGLMAAAILAGSEGYTEYGPIADKLRVLMTPFYIVGSPSDFILALFAFGIAIWGLATGRLTVIAPMRPALILLAAVAAAMPVWLMRTWGVDMRMPIILVLVVIASSRLHIGGELARAVLIALAVVLFAARLYSITELWSQVDRDYAEFRSASSVIPRGSRIMSVQPLPTDGVVRAGGVPQAYWGLPAIAVIEQSAFVPTLFTDPEKQILHAAARNEIIDTPFGRPPSLDDLEEGANPALRGAIPERHYTGKPIFWTDWPHRFDYAVVLFDQPVTGAVRQHLIPVHTGTFFAIYRVVPGSCNSLPADKDRPHQHPCASPAGDAETETTR